MKLIFFSSCAFILRVFVPLCAKISYVESRALPELFFFTASCLIIGLCAGIELGGSYIAILVPSLSLSLLSSMLSV